jgi:preprotein translocase subunit YajC
LLAQNGDGAPGGGLMGMLPLMIILMVLFYFMIIRPQKSREKRFRVLVDNLKKNDRVITIGGIHGVVTNVQKDVDRVTIRVDEGTGTTLRVRTNAISEVVTDDKEAQR